jgi:hypothetical protein
LWHGHRLTDGNRKHPTTPRRKARIRKREVMIRRKKRKRRRRSLLILRRRLRRVSDAFLTMGGGRA